MKPVNDQKQQTWMFFWTSRTKFLQLKNAVEKMKKRLKSDKSVLMNREKCFIRRCDIRYNDILHDDTQSNGLSITALSMSICIDQLR